METAVYGIGGGREKRMNLSKATKQQLYAIAIDEMAKMSDRYEAAKELQDRRKGMKDWKCNACGKTIEVIDNYKPEFCCSGHECGCYGQPVNPVFCEDCEGKILGIGVEVEK